MNGQELAKNSSLRFAVNSFSDLTSKEYTNSVAFPTRSATQLFAKKDDSAGRKYFESVLGRNESVPDELDWRKFDKRVTPVKNQGKCGSCWAFSTAGMLEGQELVQRQEERNGSLVELSIQELLDCSGSNFGCMGGYVEYALDDVATLGGLTAASDYPYECRQRRCRRQSGKTVMSSALGGYSPPAGLQEDSLKELVAKYGPLAVAVDASSEKFRDYSGGVYYEEPWQYKLGHAVLLVGYGRDETGGDYWLVKNSFGREWGEQGYVRVARNRGGFIGLPQTPTIAYF